MNKFFAHLTYNDSILSFLIHPGDGDYDIFREYKEDIQRRLSDTTIEWKRQALCQNLVKYNATCIYSVIYGWK